MDKVFGANWRTTVSGGITRVLSSVVTGVMTFPSDFHNYRQDAMFLCVLAATFFGIQFAMQTKDRNVTGGTISQDANNDVAKPKPSVPDAPMPAIPRVSLLIACLLPLFLLAGCDGFAVNGSYQAKNGTIYGGGVTVPPSQRGFAK